jgi:hypothetical protein
MDFIISLTVPHQVFDDFHAQIPFLTYPSVFIEQRVDIPFVFPVAVVVPNIFAPLSYRLYRFSTFHSRYLTTSVSRHFFISVFWICWNCNEIVDKFDTSSSILFLCIDYNSISYLLPSPTKCAH